MLPYFSSLLWEGEKGHDLTIVVHTHSIGHPIHGLSSSFRAYWGILKLRPSKFVFVAPSYARTCTGNFDLLKGPSIKDCLIYSWTFQLLLSLLGNFKPRTFASLPSFDCNTVQRKFCSLLYFHNLKSQAKSWNYGMVVE